MRRGAYFVAGLAFAVAAGTADGQRTRGATQQTASATSVSAPVTDLRYTVAFDRRRAERRMLQVRTTFNTPGREPVLLSLPQWTPGAYEISNFARNVHNFSATADGAPLDWDKIDPDTWRVMPNGKQTITVAFDYRADSLDNAMSWSREDFAFFNGTNIFIYPEGRPLDFSAIVTVETEPDWHVATGMTATGPRSFTARNYHDLVDMPTFIGRFDLDSTQIADKWVRLATYPAGMLGGDARRDLWEQHQRMFPPMIKVFGESPHEHYTTLIVFDSSYGGGSALEHQNSHVGIYTPFIIGNPVLPSITAHEIFHLWNVKRMRPAELVPYRYDRMQPTTLLWVSEGITDYYADLALVRGGIIDSTGFLEVTNGKISEVNEAPPTALEDASLSTWIHPTDGSGYLYYPKGSLAGFMLDIMIRDASDNAQSLDDVMREVYASTYKRGRGFSDRDWWQTVSRAAGGRSFAEFAERYIDGRDPFPWETVLPLAGLRMRTDTIKEPRLGVFTAPDSAGEGVRITELEEGGAAQVAGVRIGDILLQVGDIPVNDVSFGSRFRAQYSRAEGQEISVRVRRGSEVLTLTMRIRMTSRLNTRLIFDRTASPKAVRIRQGIMRG